MDTQLKLPEQNSEWTEFLVKLHAFKKDTGTANPSPNYKDWWLVNMCKQARDAHKKSELPFEVVAELNGMGFSFNRFKQKDKLVEKLYVDKHVKNLYKSSINVAVIASRVIEDREFDVKQAFSFDFNKPIEKAYYEKFVKTILESLINGYSVKIISHRKLPQAKARGFKPN